MKRWIGGLRRIGFGLTCAAMLIAGAAEAQTGREIMQTQKDRHDTGI